jgi:hypothetical protein
MMVHHMQYSSFPMPQPAVYNILRLPALALTATLAPEWDTLACGHTAVAAMDGRQAGRQGRQAGQAGRRRSASAYTIKRVRVSSCGVQQAYRTMGLQYNTCCLLPSNSHSMLTDLPPSAQAGIH